MLRAAGWVMAAVFLLAAAVQFNDPDPLGWMAIYLAAEAVSPLAGREAGVSWSAPALVGGIALAWAVVLLPQVAGEVHPGELFAAWEMKNETVEVAREAGGLLVVFAWMAFLAAASLARGSGRRPRELT